MVLACPECDDTGIDSRPGGYGRPKRRHDERWRCRTCGAVFGTPVDRPSKHEGKVTLNGLARRLADADSDEVSR